MEKSHMNNDYRRQIWETDKEHFLHPWTHFASFKTEGALPLSQGEGCYLTDIEGRRYFDAVGGLWCTNIGLGREEMAQATAYLSKSRYRLSDGRVSAQPAHA